MSKLHNIEFRCEDGDPNRITVQMDGKPVEGLISLGFEANAATHPAVVVRMEMYATLVVDADLRDITKRVLATRDVEGGE